MLAGGVALASGGFAIGSQSGGGSADAARSTGAADERRVHFRGGPGGPRHAPFGSLADHLGVSEAKLREALEDLRPTGDPEAELAAALAKSLSLEQAKVEEALTQLRSRHERRHEARHAEHAAALARELGIEASRVRAALDELKPGPGARGPLRDPGDVFAGLARELGVTQAELRAAMREVGPPRGGPGRHGPGRREHRGPGGALAEDLAEAPGVDAARVREALDAFHEQKHAEFARKLAEELGISVEKVEEALPPKP